MPGTEVGGQEQIETRVEQEDESAGSIGSAESNQKGPQAGLKTSGEEHSTETAGRVSNALRNILDTLTQESRRKQKPTWPGLRTHFHVEAQRTGHKKSNKELNRSIRSLRGGC